MAASMSAPQTFRLDILPEPQRLLWDELGQVGPEFVLYGGTAIALRLGHRQSMDFDLFSTSSFSPRELRRRIGFLKGAAEQQSAPNTLVCLLDRRGPVQVSFFGGLDLNRVEEPEKAPNGLLVASLLDLAATKVKAVLDRASYKDYLDVSELLRAGVPLSRALGAARAVYGPEYNPLLSLKALTFFDEGDVSSISAPIRHQLEVASRSVDVGKIPELGARPGVAPEGFR
jgi:hypothetical protein